MSTFRLVAEIVAEGRFGPARGGGGGIVGAMPDEDKLPKCAEEICTTGLVSNPWRGEHVPRVRGGLGLPLGGVRGEGSDWRGYARP